MNVAFFTGVDEHRLAGMRHGQRLGLGFAEFGPLALSGRIVVGHEVGKLAVIEGEIAPSPMLAPVANHQGEGRPILPGPLRVALALIPDRALQGVGNHGLDLVLEKHPGRKGLRRSLGAELLEKAIRFQYPFLASLQGRIFVHALGTDPKLDGSGRLEGGNQAHGDIELLLEILAKIVADGREAAGRRRAGRQPAPAVIVSQGWIRRSGHLLLALQRTGQAHRHVRLAGADPDLADSDVGDRQPVPALHNQFERTVAGSVEIELHLPSPIGPGPAFRSGVSQGHNHSLARRAGPTRGPLPFSALRRDGKKSAGAKRRPSPDPTHR